MKGLIILLLAGNTTIFCHAQSLIGRWQIVKQTTCGHELLPGNQQNEASLIDTKTHANKTPQIITFDDKNNGEENTKIFNTNKYANTKHFFYKLDSGTLYILDKRSKLIIDRYDVEKLQRDTLIISNTSRPCETKVFARIK